MTEEPSEYQDNTTEIHRHAMQQARLYHQFMGDMTVTEAFSRGLIDVNQAIIIACGDQLIQEAQEGLRPE
jgi:hypothetical protein